MRQNAFSIFILTISFISLSSEKVCRIGMMLCKILFKLSKKCAEKSFFQNIYFLFLCDESTDKVKSIIAHYLITIAVIDTKKLIDLFTRRLIEYFRRSLS